MAERGSGAKRAVARAPRRKVSSRKVGTGRVAARSPIRKPRSAIASSASRTAPPVNARRMLFLGVKTAGLVLSIAGAATAKPESASGTSCREDDCRSRCSRLRSARISAAL